jgi:biopolymer transport protein ExbD
MRPKPARHWAVVELTPLVDVVFLLVIFFLVAADATRLSHPPANLVAGPGEAPQGTRWDVVLTLGVDGFWRTSMDAPPLRGSLPAGLNAEARVLLRVDKDAPGIALTAMAEQLRLVGAQRVNLALGEGVQE